MKRKIILFRLKGLDLILTNLLSKLVNKQCLNMRKTLVWEGSFREKEVIKQRYEKVFAIDRR